MEILDVAKLFRAHNRTRLERLIELAPPQHQVFLQLLPLIFQSNDASLPCYVEGAPFGIVDYQPTETLLGLAKKHYAGLAYSKHAFREYPIQGLYLINDSGSIFYPEQPRFDLWLIYDSHNSDGQTQLLKSKLQTVIKHAKSIGIRLNARILNNAAVNEHKIDSDALDRFYSCGLVMAGCVPLWWLISPSDEQDYANHATTLLNSTPKELSLLDFGPLSHRSATKLVETAIQSSQNAMEKGLPEFLDLYFCQYVMTHFDDNIWLSSRYKQAVYAQETNTFLCDPLLLKFDVVSERLDATHQHQLRQSLYLNCKERLSLTVNNPRYVWRRENMSDFVNEWQWQKEDLVPLEQRHEATIRNRLTEFNLTKSILESFNAELAAFAQARAGDTRKLIVQMDKQFHDIFDSPPGVIPALPDAFVAENSEDTLYVEFDDGEALWFISESQRSFVKKGESFIPLYQHENLLPTLAWAVINGALSKFSRVKLVANTEHVNAAFLFSLVEFLVQSPLASKEHTADTFSWLMFANTEKTPDVAYKQQDMKLAIQLRDPLNYGYHRRNLVLNLEALACPNGTAWHYLHHQGDSAIGESLSSLVRWQDPTTTSLHQFDSWCPTPQFNSAINKRLITLAEEVMAHVKTSPEQGSYLYEVGDRVCRLQWTQGNVDAARYARKHDLNAILAQTRQELFMTHVDHYLDPDGLYQLLLHNQHSGQVRVFIDTQRTETHIFVLDELGHLDKLKPTQLKESTLLANLNQFLGEIPTLNHNKAAFYKLHHIDGGWTAKLLTLPEVKTSNTYLPVIVTMDSTQVDSSCVISCGPKTFTGKTNDIELFKQLSQFILTLRQSDNHFPLYITQLMFKQSSPIPTTHDYLAFKQHIENLLNIR